MPGADGRWGRGKRGRWVPERWRMWWPATAGLDLGKRPW